ncbi:DEAD/DEAH box helicase [Brevundimonas pondensis]|uniref:ATP-binding protein n=1 Tax=Brevundimonas pondensis TaxID=2774189 RepID=A0ABX7SNA9_9CAUL|nr:DEAD/DEAH box helicase [Brevundimonas pondensis]QTC89186.1 ATP-binding protein [Brevundimonas pondensis]
MKWRTARPTSGGKVSLRPYLSSTIADLEQLFENGSADPRQLQALAKELDHRTTNRARILAGKVRSALDSLEAPPRETVAATPAPSEPVVPSIQLEQEHPTKSTPQSAKSITNDAVDILQAWTALEVLSPQAYVRPEALAGDDRRNIAQLDRGLPWERGDKAKPGTRVYYQIVLGAIDMPKAVERLTRVFSDSRAERPSARGKAPLAILIVDQRGRPIEDDPVAIASFGWGLPQALAGRVSSLANWADAEPALIERVEKIVRRQDKSSDPIPVTSEMLTRAYRDLVAALDVPTDLVSPPAFAVRSYVGFKSAETPSPLLINSFFLRDLDTARTLVRTGRAPRALQQYLGLIAPTGQRDLLDSRAALSGAVAPHLHPPVRWPGRGRHPLVLLQQAAVNLARQETRDGGIVGVNGPPGTGKTTLLRDLVAAVVTDRAREMVAFDDPEDAFTSSNQRLKAGNNWLHLYSLASSLRGHELLVASSNNKAVENISAELPASSAIADDEPGLRYWKTTSDALLQRDSWGLIAAVLGNAANRYRFRQTFWWDKDVGLSTYLDAARGSKPVVEEEGDGVNAPVMERPPRVVTAENAPTSRSEALQRWEEARRRFSTALQESEANLAELETVRRRWATLPRLLEAVEKLHQASTLRPGFWSRLFRLSKWRAWRSALEEARAELEAPLTATTEGKTLPTPLLNKLSQWCRLGDPPSREGQQILDALSTIVAAVVVRREEIGSSFVDRAFFDQAHEDRHTSTPWLNPVTQRSRDQVFVAALDLHKAFIDAAARPVRHNVGALMNVFAGTALTTPDKRALLPHLWSTLFLITPVISTTFASMDRMFEGLPPDSLGWLLVDEAGQATPQSAVGGLIRSRRAVVVGDPIQIPPVVTLPDTLTDAIQRHFGVDPDRFNAPAASTQTLADAATPYMAEFTAGAGTRTVGVPLLVHRRCADPMFSIANAVAYGRLMVQAKRPGQSPIGDVLGPSRWIDVEGGATDKWSPEEGEATMALLMELRSRGVDPALYVVSPFVAVKDGLRRAILESRVLEGWVADPKEWVKERVGTVHTVQGREAEAVIFVLGAPLAQQRGARGWAGGQPNLLNVAITRAQERLYVIGNRTAWKDAGVFGELARRLQH